MKLKEVRDQLTKIIKAHEGTPIVTQDVEALGILEHGIAIKLAAPKSPKKSATKKPAPTKAPAKKSAPVKKAPVKAAPAKKGKK